MNRIILTTITVCTLILLSSTIFAQTTTRDIVYLKKGSVIKGLIIEQVPNQTLKIQTADGSIFVYEFTEIERIEKEALVIPDQQAAGPFNSRINFTVQGGIVLPTGEFAAQAGSTAGAAIIGFGFGGELRVPIGRSAFWLLATTFSFNSMSEEAFRNSIGLPSTVNADIGNWISIAPLTGVGVIIPTSETMAVQFSGRIGFLIGSTPAITLSSGGTSASQSSSSATAFAYGFSGGLLLASDVSIVIQYQSGKPKFEVTASGPGGSSTAAFEQTMSLVQIMVGAGL